MIMLLFVLATFFTSCINQEFVQIIGPILGALAGPSTGPSTDSGDVPSDPDVCIHIPIEATCTSYSVCELCGDKLSDSYAPHDYENATCIAPKKCTVCGNTEGEADGDHVYDSSSDRTCKLCKKTRTVEVSYTDEYDEPTHKLETVSDVVSTDITVTADTVYYVKVYA